MAQKKSGLPPRRRTNAPPEFGVRDFTYGYVDKVDETKLAAGALKSAWNMFSRIVGRIDKRNGQAYLNTAEIGSPETGHYPIQGMETFYSGNLKYLVVVVNGVAYSCTPPASEFTSFKTGLDADAPVMFASAMIDGVNCIIGFNGVDTPFKWDGTTCTDLQDYRIVNGEEPTTTDFTVYTLPNTGIRTGTGKYFVFSNDTLLVEAAYTLDPVAGTITFPTDRINTVANTDDDGVTIAYPLNGIFVSPHVYKAECTVTPYDKNNVAIVQDNDTRVTVSYGNGTIPGQVTIQGGLINGGALTTSDHLTYTARFPFQIGGEVVVKDKDDHTLTPSSTDNDAGTVTFAASQETVEPLTITYAWDMVDIMPVTIAYEWTDKITVDYQYTNGNVPSDYHAPCYHRGRIFCISESSIVWSDITEYGSEYECWPPINTWGIQEGDGEEPSICLSVQNELFIMKPSSIHRLRGSDLTDYRLDKIISDIGCAGPRAGCVHNNMCYIVSEQGLFSFDGTSVSNLVEERIPLLWDRVNKIYLHQAAVHTWHNLILFALPLDDSTTNNVVFAHVPSTGAFWPWNGMNILDWCQFITTSGTKLYSADNTKGHIVLQDYGSDDFGTNITAYFEPTVFSGDMANREKKSKYIDIEYGPDQATWGTIYASEDGAAYTEIPAFKKDGQVRRYKMKPTLDGKWRYIGLRIVHDTADAFELRSIKVPYKIKRKPKIKGAL